VCDLKINSAMMPVVDRSNRQWQFSLVAVLSYPGYIAAGVVSGLDDHVTELAVRVLYLVCLRHVKPTIRVPGTLMIP
jgi:hypothetical protein